MSASAAAFTRLKCGRYQTGVWQRGRGERAVRVGEERRQELRGSRWQVMSGVGGVFSVARSCAVWFEFAACSPYDRCVF